MARKSSAERLAEMQAREAVAAPDMAGTEDGIGGGMDGRPPRLKQPCPVSPVGRSSNAIYLLDRDSMMIVASTKCEKGDLMLWFGNDWLETHYPQTKIDRKGVEYNVPGEFDQRDVQIALVEDCRAEGIFNPRGKVFGRGAHRFPGDAGTLVLHLGSMVAMANAPGPDGKRRREIVIRKAGRVEGANGRKVFYPALEALPKPAAQAATAEEGQALLALLSRWNFKERDAGPLLLLGLAMAMYVCGALQHRPHGWLTGPTASGKTTLLKLIDALHEGWCLRTEDSSEAAIRQVLGDDTLPVLIDEAEAHDKPERLQAILNLMKKAYSGAKMYRGGQDHKAQDFTAQSCFLLSSVLHATLRGEDRNRLAMLDMLPLPGNAERMELDEAHWQEVGRRLRRRMMDHWHRFDRTLTDYAAMIARRGFTGRWCDTYGTLLACADLVLFDHDTRVNTMGGDMIPDEKVEPGPIRVQRLVAMVAPTMGMAQAEAQSDVDRVIQYLMSTSLPGSGGQPPEPISLWLDRAMAWHEDNNLIRGPNKVARMKLRAHGLRLISWRQTPGGGYSYEEATPEDWGATWLAVAYDTNRGIAELFRGSDWQGSGYLQSMAKIAGAEKGKFKVRFASDGSKSDNCVVVPLMAMRGED